MFTHYVAGSNTLTLCIAGSRGFTRYDVLKTQVTKYITALKKAHNYREVVILSGGAEGADTLAEQYAEEQGYCLVIYLPNWKRDGKSAGFKRNLKMAKTADAVIVFWDGESRGTAHMIKTCREANKALKVFQPQRKKSTHG